MVDCYTSEEDVLDSINRFFPHSNRRQDDATLLSHDSYITSVDIVAENLDFRLSTFAPQHIGYKALAVNISDCLAMGAIPRYILMALVLPHNIKKSYFEAILEGMSRIAEHYHIILVGGDIAFEDSLQFAITILGRPITQPIYRGNASQGDSIFYIPSLAMQKPLGLARVGFETLERGVEGYEEAKQAQREPSLIEIETLELLAPFAEMISLMDCSDGLFQDIPRLLATRRSSLTADIRITESILHDDVLSWCSYIGCNPLDFAFHGGEEYCLLGTAPPHVMRLLQESIPHCVVIGTVI